MFKYVLEGSRKKDSRRFKKKDSKRFNIVNYGSQKVSEDPERFKIVK